MRSLLMNRLPTKTRHLLKLEVREGRKGIPLTYRQIPANIDAIQKFAEYFCNIFVLKYVQMENSFIEVP